MNEAVEQAIEALNDIPNQNDETEDALDRMERLRQEQMKNDQAAEEKWGVWNIDRGSWVNGMNGAPLVFEDDREARDWLNARGGVV